MAPHIIDRSYHHDIENLFYKNRRNRRCKGAFKPRHSPEEIAEARSMIFAWGPKMGY